MKYQDTQIELNYEVTSDSLDAYQSSIELGYGIVSTYIKFYMSSILLFCEANSYDDTFDIFGIVLDFIETYGGIY